MITVGIVSPRISLEVIDKVIDSQDFGCTFNKYVYEKLEDIDEIYDQCKTCCDVIFCSGELGYHRITSLKCCTIPCTFVSYEVQHVLSILLNFVLEHPGVPLNRVYCDFLIPHNNYLNLSQYISAPYLPYCFELYDYNYENLLTRASALWQAGKIDFVLSRTANLLARLDELHIPYQHFLPTEAMVSESIWNAVNQQKLQTRSLKQVCVIIRLLVLDDLPRQEQEFWEITLYKHLLDFRRLHSIPFAVQRSALRFELTIEEQQPGSQWIQELSAYLTENRDLAFRLGAGVGITPDDSHYQAERALRESIQYGKSDGFILRGDSGLLTGPLSLDATLHYSYYNQKAIEFSQQKGIHESNLLKIVGLFQMDHRTTVTAATLSSWLNITTRSCNRIIQQLVDAELLVEIETLPPDGKGRPMRQYRFQEQNCIEMLL